MLREEPRRDPSCTPTRGQAKRRRRCSEPHRRLPYQSEQIDWRIIGLCLAFCCWLDADFVIPRDRSVAQLFITSSVLVGQRTC